MTTKPSSTTLVVRPEVLSTVDERVLGMSKLNPILSGQRRVALAGYVAQASDLLERFRAFAQTEAHPNDLDEPTRQLLAALSALTAARTAMRKAGAS